MREPLLAIMQNAKIVVDPTPRHRRQLRKWLRDEQTNSRSGFYCNWQIINDAFKEKQIQCVCYRNNAIAFGVFGRLDTDTELSIVEVHPKYRNRGVGKVLMHHLIRYFREHDVRYVHLECVPASSEVFWRSLGFRAYRNSEAGDSRVLLRRSTRRDIGLTTRG